MGGVSARKDTDPETRAFFVGLKSEIEAATGHHYETFEPHQYAVQVVAGNKYKVVIRVGAGDHDYIHANIFRPLPHTGQPATVNNAYGGQTIDSPFQ